MKVLFSVRGPSFKRQILCQTVRPGSVRAICPRVCGQELPPPPKNDNNIKLRKRKSFFFQIWPPDFWQLLSRVTAYCSQWPGWHVPSTPLSGDDRPEDDTLAGSQAGTWAQGGRVTSR